MINTISENLKNIPDELDKLPQLSKPINCQGYTLTNIKCQKKCKNNANYCNLHDPQNINQCLICLESITSLKSSKKLSCDHIYHLTCIKKWEEFSSNCPVCRSYIVNTPENEIKRQAHHEKYRIEKKQEQEEEDRLIALQIEEEELKIEEEEDFITPQMYMVYMINMINMMNQT
jgi:hypothetical protein